MGTDLRVLLWDPAPSPFGGHVVQMDMTAEFLSRIDGVTVRTSRDDVPGFDGIDIVHGFELEPRHVREARLRGLPVCISVIYWSKDYRTGRLARSSLRECLVGRARIAASLTLASAGGNHQAKAESLAQFVIHTRALYESADLLLPNSRGEAESLVRDLQVTTPIRVVPNAVDPARFPPGLPWDEREGVVYAGRIEPHKNQLALIRALRGTGVPVTIVGGDHPHHPEYAAAVRAEAGDDVRFAGQVAHDELSAFYARARVHALPSRFETTGLVSLEAALCGCNVVTTSVGHAREYLGGDAWYCDPYDLDSIREAVLDALRTPARDGLRARILENYTWDRTAAATLSAYRELVDRRRAPDAQT